MTTDVPGDVYLLHFLTRYRHAGHYTGFAEEGNLDARLAAHRAGNGANLMKVIKEAGIEWELARTWKGTRARERQLKTQGGASRRCPRCKDQPAIIAADPKPFTPPSAEELATDAITTAFYEQSEAHLADWLRTIRERDQRQLAASLAATRATEHHQLEAEA